MNDRPTVSEHFTFREGHHYAVDPETGCWRWLLYKLRGYAHGVGKPYRKAFEEVHGPIPRGYDIHHTCRQTDCINPAHLELMTTSEHRTMHARERGKLTLEQAAEIREMVVRERALSMTRIGEQFGVSADEVERIAKGKDFRELGGPVLYEVTCGWCDAEIRTRERRRRYCSVQHRQAFNNEKFGRSK